ncbi:UNVERIFIED_CONTAM: hypothetical protein Sradi_7169700 [Sesamum radiatum]|uniref:Uncharacterized protein n=1 Tax=Sesamum radiatum TaxID=300843 RepID=A0AAW2IUV3_SESRA
MAKDAVRTVQHTVPEEDGTGGMEIGTDERSYIDRGKAVVVYNPFDALLLTDDGDSDRGPISSPLKNVT